MKQINIPYKDTDEIAKFCEECLHENFVTLMIILIANLISILP